MVCNTRTISVLSRMTDPSASSFLFSDYAWHQSKHDPQLYSRRGFGMEVLCDLMPRFDRFKTHGNTCAALSVQFTSLNTLTQSELLSKLRSAWELTRLRIPSIAATVHQDLDGWTQFRYRVPNSYEDLRTWSTRTLKIAEGSLADVRTSVGSEILPDSDGYQVFLYLVPDRDTQKFGLALHGYHTVYDLAGALMVVNQLLIEFGGQLEPGAQDEHDFQLGTEVGNLLPPCDYNLLPKAEFDDGRKIEERLLKSMRLLKDTLRNPGPALNAKASHRTIRYHFDQAESDLLLNSIKRSGFTVNQIAHAAIALVILQSHPPDENTPIDAKLFYIHPVNLRRLLRPPYSNQHAYPGLCIGISPVEIPLSVYNAGASPNLKKPRRGDILTFAGILKQEYSKTSRMQDTILNFSDAIEIMTLEQGLDEPSLPNFDLGHGTSVPATSLTSPVQAFSGDGVAEAMLNPRVQDKQGNTVLKIVDFFAAVNMSEIIPNFRLHSWGGEIHLTVNFNDRTLDKEAMWGFLTQWADNIRLILVEGVDSTPRYASKL